jgi:lysyl-tRNA synthetase class 2
MKPETPAKVPSLSKPEEYIALGVPEEWIEPLQALGYTSIDKIKAFEKPGKLANDLNGYKKKNKLEISTVTMEDVDGWLGD